MAKVHPFGHESPSLRTGAVLKVGALLFGTMVATLIVLYFTTMSGLLAHHVQAVRRPSMVPPPPRLQAHPDADLARVRRDKRQELSSYGWEGPPHRYAHIPIKRAMQLYVQMHDKTDHAPPRKGGKP